MESIRAIRALVILIGLSFLLAATPPTSQPVGDVVKLANGLIEFNAPPPPLWPTHVHDPARESAVFTTEDRKGQIVVLLLPTDASVDDNVKVAIVKKYREITAKLGVKVILPATIEKDSRFDIRIREKYQSGKIMAENLHLYKQIGPRILELDANSFADDPDKVATIQKDGEQVLLGAKFKRK